MDVIETQIDPQSELFRANAARLTSLVAELRDRVAAVKQIGRASWRGGVCSSELRCSACTPSGDARPAATRPTAADGDATQARSRRLLPLTWTSSRRRSIPSPSSFAPTQRG